MSKIDEIMGAIGELENAAMAWAVESGFDPMTVGPVEAQNKRVRDMIAAALADARRLPTGERQAVLLTDEQVQHVAHTEQAQTLPDCLIAAAPDMLQALREIADDYEDRFDIDDPSTNPGIRLTIKRARAAISKAEGGA